MEGENTKPPWFKKIILGCKRELLTYYSRCIFIFILFVSLVGLCYYCVLKVPLNFPGDHSVEPHLMLVLVIETKAYSENFCLTLSLKNT